MLSFALLGCGQIGRVHAGTIAAHRNARLAACFDLDPAAAQSVAAAHGAHVAGSPDEIMTDPAIDAVLIASATPSHLDLIKQAARAGKPVFCEKPIDLDLSRVDECWAEIGAGSPPIMIGFNRRFDPSFRALRERVQAGEIGQLEQVVITSRDPRPPTPDYVAESGGLFRDMTIHDFDMARYLAGEIESVFASGANLIDPAHPGAGDFDAAMVILRAASGTLLHINNSRRCAYGYDQRIEAFGARGMLVAGNRHPTTVAAWTESATHARDKVQDFFMERYADAYAAEIDHFMHSVLAGTQPEVGFADGRAALALADAAGESARTGRVVQL